MSNIVNLRTIRKQKAREQVEHLKAKRVAAESGVKKTERNRVISLNDMADRKLDGHEILDE